jgi:dolichol-phosphate mannosyltransferase
MITTECSSKLEQGDAAGAGTATLDRRSVALAKQVDEPVVWIVLPAYNEQEALSPLLDAIQQALEPARVHYSVIVVDDGSRDNTAGVVGEASFRMPVELVAHDMNRGLAAALRTGLSEALGRSGPDDVIVTMDCDNTHPPRLIPGMLAKLRGGRDVVIASRFQPGAQVTGVPRLRNFYSLGARWLFQILFPIKGVRDYTCGYRAYRASCLGAASERFGEKLISETGFSCMADLLLKLRQLDVEMAEVPLDLHYENRGGGSKMRVLRTIRQTLLLMMRRRFGRQ